MLMSGNAIMARDHADDIARGHGLPSRAQAVSSQLLSGDRLLPRLALLRRRWCLPSVLSRSQEGVHAGGSSPTLRCPEQAGDEFRPEDCGADPQCSAGRIQLVVAADAKGAEGNSAGEDRAHRRHQGVQAKHDEHTLPWRAQKRPAIRIHSTIETPARSRP
ncbi:hypothetical protein [Dactylosporangium matsuzakiense]|uniref:hypothetical protein n=1 Tax=Dactylosporangium matsuzakiense TaxID=53360 RepID=UPI0021C3D218|nr:hypothetical protein [Dactylosporangium matsuzakiense]UWZ47837.1 hypothetical protein Dmats_16385 [Dactylosporangium matsuzakiense]